MGKTAKDDSIYSNMNSVGAEVRTAVASEKCIFSIFMVECMISNG